MNHSAVEILILYRHAFRRPLLLVPMAPSLLIFLLLLFMLVDHVRGLHEEAAFGNFQHNVTLLLFVAVAVVVKDVLFSDFYLDVWRWRRRQGRLLAGRGLPAAFLDFLTKEKKNNQSKSKSINKPRTMIINQKANQSLNQEQPNKQQINHLTKNNQSKHK